MTIPVLILGEPGSGKSSSIKRFKKKEVVVVQTIGKPLPFRNDLDILQTREIGQAAAWMPNITRRAVVLDDFGYYLTDTYMRLSYGDEKARDQFEVYKRIANEVYNFIVTLMEDGRTDRIAYLMMHIERNNFGEIEPATIGKLLNEKVKLMGMVTIALHAVCDSGEYKIITNGQPFKSPPDMFQQEIPNDLKAVDAAIRDYWNMPPLTDGDQGGDEQ